MTEEKLNALRQQDTNLRDALQLDEAELPQMPADLNKRLMQRVAAQAEKKPRRIVWPWIAAACVAGVLMIWLTPPKDEPTDVVAKNKPKVEQPVKVDEPMMVEVRPEDPQPVETPTRVGKTKMVMPVQQSSKKLLAQQTPVAESPETPTEEETHTVIVETAQPQAELVTLTERDIPVTRPENYRYTPEELALMKKQANEAYLKWVELELEISKQTLEQTVQK
jgi:hypothetical protein